MTWPSRTDSAGGWRNEAAPVSRLGVPLSESVHNRLLDMIVYGEFTPGERLREVQVSEMLGTSRVPVREAIQRLADDGWVDRRPRSGARVRVPTLSDIDDLFDLRAVLEQAAIERAARFICQDDIDALRGVIAGAKDAALRGDQRAVVEANHVFHRATAELSGNALLERSLLLMDKRVQWLFSSVALARSDRSLPEHEGILAALEDRDVAEAMRLVRLHVRGTRDALRAQWGERLA